MDKRTQNTRERIRNAYIALLTAADAPKLTVTALAQRANIDRKTFYLHYDTTDDVLLDISRQLNERLMQLLAENHFLEEEGSVGVIYRVMGQIISENMMLFQYLALHPGAGRILEQIKSELVVQLTESYRENVLIPPENLHVYFRYLLGGMQEIYRGWLRGEMPMEPDELSRTVSDAAFEGFSTVLR